jgi:hypothetical protein
VKVASFVDFVEWAREPPVFQFRRETFKRRKKVNFLFWNCGQSQPTQTQVRLLKLLHANISIAHFLTFFPGFVLSQKICPKMCPKCTKIFGQSALNNFPEKTLILEVNQSNQCIHSSRHQTQVHMPYVLF